ncbi:MAG: ATP-binding protein [Actinomycetota bacterium]|nr:ATP-binding protein [Actinomycetota bacterium]
MNVSIRVRMTVWYVGLLALILAGVGTFISLRLRADLISGTDRGLHAASLQIARGYHGEGVLEFRDAARAVLLGERPAAQVLAPSGAVLAAFGDPVSQIPMLRGPTLAAASAGAAGLRSTQLGSGSRFRVIARRVVRRGEQQVLVTGVSLGPVDRSVHRVLVLLFIALPASLLATAFGGWWLARRALRPVEKMTTTAELIGVGRLRDRIAVPPARDELGHLATTLNTMLDRIAQSVEEQQRLIADTSHELRTPLTAMRSEIDVSLLADDLSEPAREVLVSVREEVDRMSATVEDLLTLAAADEGRLVAGRAPVDLRREADAVAGALAQLAARRGTVVRVVGEHAEVPGDAKGLRHALRNLVENAIKFGPDGGVVTVRVSTSRACVLITVEDDGPGVPDAVRERIFDRYFRVEGSRTRKAGGSGLGLAIVREIAHVHGGNVAVQPREPTGSSFVLSLPLSGNRERAARPD